MMNSINSDIYGDLSRAASPQLSPTAPANIAASPSDYAKG